MPSHPIFRYGRKLGAASVFIGWLMGPAKATVTVSPNSAAGTEGVVHNAIPFFTSTGATAPSYRYQQVFNAGDFASLPAAELITQIAFRPDSSGTAFSTVLPKVEIHLSTTGRAADNLLPTFADNIGRDELLVFSGALTLFSDVRGPANGPKGFDIVIPLQVPFLYNPTQGNLLLDVKNFSLAGISYYLDSVTGDDSVSRLFTWNNQDVDSLVGSADTDGLVTQFTSVTVPEPFTIAQLVGLALGFCRCRRRCVAEPCQLKPAVRLSEVHQPQT